MFVQPFRIVGVTDLAVYGCDGTVHVVCLQRTTVNALGCLYGQTRVCRAVTPHLPPQNVEDHSQDVSCRSFVSFSQDMFVRDFVVVSHQAVELPVSMA